MVFALPHYIPGLCLLIILLAAYQAAGMGLTFFWRKLRFIIIFGSLIFFVHLIFVHKGVLLWQSSLLGLQLQICLQVMMAVLTVSLYKHHRPAIFCGYH